jgi:hypothetical protein
LVDRILRRPDARDVYYCLSLQRDCKISNGKLIAIRSGKNALALTSADRLRCASLPRVTPSNANTRRRPRFTTPEIMRFLPCYPFDPLIEERCASPTP